MLKQVRWMSVVVLAALSAASSAWAGDGGTLKGRFIYDGKAPAAAPIKVVGGDAAFCGKKEHKDKLVDESLVVGKDGGLANVFVYMYLGRDGKVDIHPAWEAKKKDAVRLDNVGCRFAPHCLGLWTEQKIILGNKDEMGHNTKVDGISGKSINPLIPPGGELEESFDVSERLPLQVGCNIHPWMRARLLIQDHPYFAVTDEEGNFEIKNIPPGTYNFRAYHERPGYVRNVKVDGKDVEWKLGLFEAQIEDDDTVDVGEVLVPADTLKAP